MPRHLYWTIIAGGAPTAFRARERDELLPTLRQLQRQYPDATLKWFERGRIWGSPEEARAQLAAERAQARRPHGWRPGGEHRDPRERYKKPRDVRRRQQMDRWRQEGSARPPRADRDRDWRDRQPPGPARDRVPRSEGRRPDRPARPEGQRPDRPPRADTSRWDGLRRPEGQRPDDARRRGGYREAESRDRPSGFGGQRPDRPPRDQGRREERSPRPTSTPDRAPKERPLRDGSKSVVRPNTDRPKGGAASGDEGRGRWRKPGMSSGGPADPGVRRDEHRGLRAKPEKPNNSVKKPKDAAGRWKPGPPPPKRSGPGGGRGPAGSNRRGGR
jgi:hypothetical protein